jgi:hypothetical protein
MNFILFYSKRKKKEPEHVPELIRFVVMDVVTLLKS